MDWFSVIENKSNSKWKLELDPFLLFQDRWCLVQLYYRSRNVYAEGIFIIAGQTSAPVAVDRHSFPRSIYNDLVKSCCQISHGFDVSISHRFIGCLRRLYFIFYILLDFISYFSSFFLSFLFFSPHAT
jgi:hypothetical protein